MKTTNPKTSLRSLKAALAKETAAHAAALTTISDLEKQLAGYQESQSRHESELSQQQEQLALAKSVLIPIATKTKDWNWPPLNVEVWKPLTWGDLKRLAETAVKLS